jgi:aminopeptidase N
MSAKAFYTTTIKADARYTNLISNGYYRPKTGINPAATNNTT